MVYALFFFAVFFFMNIGVDVGCCPVAPLHLNGSY